jgi:hypothetical protein
MPQTNLLLEILRWSFDELNIVGSNAIVSALGCPWILAFLRLLGPQVNHSCWSCMWLDFLQTKVVKWQTLSDLVVECSVFRLRDKATEQNRTVARIHSPWKDQQWADRSAATCIDA